MSVILLTWRTYQRVFKISQTTRDVRVLKRAQALLWLSDGEGAVEVSERLQVSIRTVYRWVEHFAQHHQRFIEQRLSDAPRSGRPADVTDQIQLLIEPLMVEPPAYYGYQAAVWTAPLLREHLHRVHQLNASTRSVSRVLERLGLHWKRPRHSLARRSPTWRQSKGGLNGASATVPAPSF